MAVETPELKMPVFQPQQMATPPQAEAQPSQGLPSAAGYVSKGAAGAYIANNLLQGWLKGREVAQQQRLAKAQNQMSGADYTYQTMAKNYNDLLRGGKAETDPDVQKAKEAAVQAWQAKLNVMQQYAMPEAQQGQKKGLGAKVKGGLSKTLGRGGLTPEIIPQASLAILRQSQPPGLGLTPEDKLTEQRLQQSQLETKESKLRVQNLESQTQTREEYANLLKLGDKVTPEQKMQRDINERLLGLSTEDQQMGRDVKRKILSGQQLSDGERQFAIANKLIEGPQTAFTEKGLDQYLTRYDPNTGKVLSQVRVGRKFHESAAAEAIAVMNAQKNGTYNMLKRAFPDKAPEELWKMVSAEYTKNPYLTAEILGDNPQQAMKDQFAVSNAIRSVMQEGGAGPQGQQFKAEFSNFVVPPRENDANGLYMFSGQVADPKTTGMLWWKKQMYAGNTSKEELLSKAGAFRNRLVAQLQKQKRTPGEIERMLKPYDDEIAGFRSGGGQQMSSPPEGGSTAGTSPSHPGKIPTGMPSSNIMLGRKTQNYMIKAPDGTTGIRPLTEEDAQYWRSQGVEVQPAQMSQQP